MNSFISNVRNDLFNLIKISIDSIKPSLLVERTVRLQSSTGSKSPDRLVILNESTENELSIDINKNVYVVAFGKAALGMSIAIDKLIGSKHLINGIAIIPFNDAVSLKSQNFKTIENDLEQQLILDSSSQKFRYYFGAKNNLPDKYSVNATSKVIDMLKSIKDNDVLITLVSGGGSALFCSPIEFESNSKEAAADENLSIKLDTIKKLVNAGANINELNTIRSCLSNVKAGNLVRRMSDRQVKIVSLIVSDVIDDPLNIIASGPTCVDFLKTSKYQQAKNAMDIIVKYNLKPKLSTHVIKLIENKLSEIRSPDSSDHLDLSNRVFNVLIGNNRLVTKSIILNSNLNYDYAKCLSNSLCGEARLVGSLFAFIAHTFVSNKSLLLKRSEMDRITLLNHLTSYLKDLKVDLFELCHGLPNDQMQLARSFLSDILNDDSFYKTQEKDSFDICLASGGETTVNLGDDVSSTGLGGRNQEMTLSFECTYKLLNKDPESSIVLFSSFGTDGIDGPTDSAGAFYTNDFSSTDNFDESIVRNHLAKHDSYNYFAKVNRLIKIGATGTNVSDIQILLIKILN